MSPPGRRAELKESLIMATRTKPLISVAALASAAAIAVATPAIAPGFTTASAPSPHALSAAQYELTTLETLLGLTAFDWQDAYFFGHGGGVTAGNEWFPFSEDNYPLYSAYQIPGVTYLALDALLNGTSPNQLDWTPNTVLSYYYELGTSAAIQVALQETVGTINPLVSQAITTFFNLPATAVSLVVGLTSFVPSFNIGPVEIGAGILSNLYFYGQTPDESYVSLSSGLPAILGYVSASVTGALPLAGATALSAAAEAPSTPAVTESATSKTESTATAVSATTDVTTPTESAPESAPSKSEATESSTPATESTPIESAPIESTPATESTPAETPAEVTDTKAAHSPSGSLAEAPASTPAADATDSAPAKVHRRPIRDAVEKAAKQITSAVSGDAKAEKSGAASGGSADAGSADSGT